MKEKKKNSTEAVSAGLGAMAAAGVMAAATLMSGQDDELQVNSPVADNNTDTDESVQDAPEAALEHPATNATAQASIAEESVIEDINEQIETEDIAETIDENFDIEAVEVTESLVADIAEEYSEPIAQDPLPPMIDDDISIMAELEPAVASIADDDSQDVAAEIIADIPVDTDENFSEINEEIIAQTVAEIEATVDEFMADNTDIINQEPENVSFDKDYIDPNDYTSMDDDIDTSADEDIAAKLEGNNTIPSFFEQNADEAENIWHDIHNLS